ncbi:hypothetical protein [Phytoactinopolyspora halophila]|uniref:hypothetical protein n=1 Tax=Phytoactinopolyspora halophila TaxID=1981511 RepID=UPI001B8C681B|nr:hypothetical protein [Phytoactinopolyspora halophila]
MVERTGIAHADTIMLVAGTTVVLSVYAHGLSAVPWARRFARRTEDLSSSAPERLAVTEHHMRAGTGHVPR